MCSPRHAILLDLDGTLIDSQLGIASSCQAALRALGHVPEPMLDLAAIIGPSMDDVMRLILEPYGDDRVGEAVAAYRADYGLNGLFQSVLYPGIKDALARMKQAGARLHLATSKRTVFAERILEHLGIAPWFDGVHGAEPGGALDGKSELIAHVLRQHGLIKDCCVMVGDRRYDVAGAHANGMRALGVLWGYGTRGELETAGADEIATEPESLAITALAMTMASSR